LKLTLITRDFYSDDTVQLFDVSEKNNSNYSQNQDVFISAFIFQNHLNLRRWELVYARLFCI